MASASTIQQNCGNSILFFQANRTAILVHKLMNKVMDPRVKGEVIVLSDHSDLLHKPTGELANIS